MCGVIIPLPTYQNVRYFIKICVASKLYSHARVATALGDDTAKNAGRLTLNPLAHLDIAGTLMLMLVKACPCAAPVHRA